MMVARNRERGSHKHESGSHKHESAPHPEDRRKPSSPTDITKPSWRYVLRATARHFSADGCLDLAAGLTYRTLLAVVPGLVAIVSFLSLLGRSGQVVSNVMDEAQQVVPQDTWDTVRPFLNSVLTAPAPGFGLIIGLLAALWSASAYVKAFARALNVIHDVREGRGLIKLNFQLYLFTALMLLLVAVGFLIVAVSGPVAQAIGSAIGVGDVVIVIWNIAKWLVLAFVVIFAIALLYYATPNVRQPKFRWISVGAVLAIVVGVLATVAFFFYVANFSNFNKTYGTLGGVVVLLLWLYIANLVLLFGAEIDSELERVRELQAGIPAEEELQLPPRDTKAIDKEERKYAEDVARARNLRMSAGESEEDPRRGDDDLRRRR